MIKTETLVAIREDFKRHHKAHEGNIKEGVELDIDPLLGMVPALIDLVEQHVTGDIEAAKKWLLDLVIKGGRAPILITVKDAVIYVLTVIDAIIAGGEVKHA